MSCHMLRYVSVPEWQQVKQKEISFVDFYAV
jgi:hypothetical protein